MSGDNKKLAKLPNSYDAYVFDLYGTLVDIHTDENDDNLWKKLALFYGYYDAIYMADEIREVYHNLVRGAEDELKMYLDGDPRYTHESSPEIDILEVFTQLFTRKGVKPTKELAIHAGQLFRVLSTEYVCVYKGTDGMLKSLKEAGKKVYLLSNAQRIFTEYEMHVLGIAKYFDDILISSDHRTRKPDKRFFDILVETYKLDVSKCLFVGNDSRTDICGAKTIGMDTFYVNSNISPENDSAPNANYSIDDFEGWTS